MKDYSDNQKTKSPSEPDAEHTWFERTLERVVFGHRIAVLVVFALITAFFAYKAFDVRLNASFEKMIPTGHPYIQNYLEYQDELSGTSNAIRIAIENEKGDIFDPDYLETVRKISDEVLLVPGVDRAFMKSLWTPSTRWMAVTERGLDGGPVIDRSYDGSEESIEQLKTNVERSGEIGFLIAPNFKSSIIYVPLLDTNPETGQQLDYGAFSERIESLRDKYESPGIDIHITGFAMKIGDLIDGLQQVLVFFGIALLICTAVIFAYTRCVRSTVVIIGCSLMAVLWLIGALPTLGYSLDPYSILVPFLVFAIGTSHAVQMNNRILYEASIGYSCQEASRRAFRALAKTGMAALVTDAAGFAVLLTIDIGAIQDLALTASLGVAALILTNLILLPVIISLIGVRKGDLIKDVDAPDSQTLPKHPMWKLLNRLTERKVAYPVLALALVLGLTGFSIGRQLSIGDLEQGAPELRQDSQYNRDVAFLNEFYSASSDVLIVMVTPPDSECSRYNTLYKLDALEGYLRQLPGVESTKSFAGEVKSTLAGLAEGNLKWAEITRNQSSINAVTTRAPRDLLNHKCNLLTLSVFLEDHKAETLSSAVSLVKNFAAQNNNEDVKFLLAAGNAGVAAATNIVVEQARLQMLLIIYGVVAALVLLTLRSWRAALCAIIPLALTSILAEALMVFLGVGVKVATLPVIALGVGIGVDYSLYMLTVLLERTRNGENIGQAYYHTLLSVGKVVLLAGLTLAIAVGTWAFSPIKFQADMGILLGFMFIGNMLGALLLIPALARVFLARSKPANS